MLYRILANGVSGTTEFLDGIGKNATSSCYETCASIIRNWYKLDILQYSKHLWKYRIGESGEIITTREVLAPAEILYNFIVEFYVNKLLSTFNTKMKNEKISVGRDQRCVVRDTFTSRVNALISKDYLVGKINDDITNGVVSLDGPFNGFLKEFNKLKENSPVYKTDIPLTDGE